MGTQCKNIHRFLIKQNYTHDNNIQLTIILLNVKKKENYNLIKDKLNIGNLI